MTKLQKQKPEPHSQTNPDGEIISPRPVSEVLQGAGPPLSHYSTILLVFIRILSLGI